MFSPLVARSITACRATLVLIETSIIFSIIFLTFKYLTPVLIDKNIIFSLLFFNFQFCHTSPYWNKNIFLSILLFLTFNSHTADPDWHVNIFFSIIFRFITPNGPNKNKHIWVPVSGPNWKKHRQNKFFWNNHDWDFQLACF